MADEHDGRDDDGGADARDDAARAADHDGPRDRAQERGDDGPASGRGSEESTWRGLLQGLKSVVSSSEDRISSVIQDAIPREMAREVVGYIKRQVDSARDESVRIVGKQIKGFLDNLDVGGELKKALTSLSFEIRTEVRFVPNERAGKSGKSSIRPDAKVRVKVKPTKDDDGDESLAKTLFRRTVDRALRGILRDDEDDEAPNAKDEREAGDKSD